MKKTFMYEEVQLSANEKLKYIKPKAVCPLRLSGLGDKLFGVCSNFKVAGPGKVTCTIKSDIDLKGRYPLLVGLLTPEGAGLTLSVVAAEGALNVDETLEPFI